VDCWQLTLTVTLVAVPSAASSPTVGDLHWSGFDWPLCEVQGPNQGLMVTVPCVNAHRCHREQIAFRIGVVAQHIDVEQWRVGWCWPSLARPLVRR
jgi:hypothetical protein